MPWSTNFTIHRKPRFASSATAAAGFNCSSRLPHFHVHFIRQRTTYAVLNFAADFTMSVMNVPIFIDISAEQQARKK